MTKRRVAMVSRYYSPFIAGAECQVRLLAGFMLDELDLCEVITTRYRSDLSRRAQDGHVPVQRLWTWQGPGARLYNFFSAFFYFLLHGHRYDVVHASCLSSFSLGALLAARLRGIRTLLLICTIGARGEIAKVKNSLFGERIWSMFLLADGIISQTPAMAASLLEEGVPKAKICMIPSIVVPPSQAPADLPGRRLLRAQLGLGDQPVVLYVGRLHQEKGLDRLMIAWPEILRQAEAVLVLVGNGPELERIERWRQDSGLASSVHLVGWQEDPTAFYQSADIFVFPSHGEAFGIVLAEAMMHELAVVTTPVGMAEDWLRHQENAWLLQTGEPSELARAVVELLRDAPRRLKLGKQARQDALASFVPEQIIPSYLQLYEPSA